MTPSKLSWLVLMKKFAIYGEAVTGWPAEISAELLFIGKLSLGYRDKNKQTKAKSKTKQQKRKTE